MEIIKLRFHTEGIPGDCRHDRTNTIAEDADDPIKVATRRGCIRRSGAFRRRILLALSPGRAEIVRITIRDVENR